MRRLVLEDTPERQQAFRLRLPGCMVVSTYSQAVAALSLLRFGEVYLDFDIEFGHNGADVASYMVRQMPVWRRPALVVVHSSNRGGGMAIQQILRWGLFSQVERRPFPPW